MSTVKLEITCCRYFVAFNFPNALPSMYYNGTHKTLALFVAALVLHLPWNSSALAPIADDMQVLALSAINNIYNERYDEAKDDAKKIIKKYPSHPAGYFFTAITIDSWMATHLSDKYEAEFYRYCEQAAEKGEKIIEKNPDDEWVVFFIGGAEGYKGTYEARYERWITAFRYGWKGVSGLMKLAEKKSDIVDLNYGIGSYEYWRSALMKSLWWMPGVEDKRAVGIEKLQKARKDGLFTKVAASVSLVDIYMNEKKYAEALAVAEEGLTQFPNSLIMLLGKGKSLFHLKKYEESAAVFQAVLLEIEKKPSENKAMAALCHYWIAKNELALTRFTEAIEECDAMKNCTFPKDCIKAMQKMCNEIESVKKQSLAGIKKARSPVK